VAGRVRKSPRKALRARPVEREFRPGHLDANGQTISQVLIAPAAFTTLVWPQEPRFRGYRSGGALVYAQQPAHGGTFPTAWDLYAGRVRVGISRTDGRSRRKGRDQQTEYMTLHFHAGAES